MFKGDAPRRISLWYTRFAYANFLRLMSQPTQYVSYYSTCEKFIFQYTTLSVDNKDGSLYGVVGTFANIIEWISEAEWEKLKEQGY